MFKTIKALFIAIRFKTLIASISPVAIGSTLSFKYGAFNFKIFLFTLLASIFIQIGTNFANDVYDYLKGADGDDRLGPTRAVQSQLISVGQMKLLTVMSFFFSILCGLPLVLKGGYPILLIGVLGVISGYLYTAGPYPLGYNGWGDFFVFCFFGPIAVCGTYYLQNNLVSASSIISGVILGSLSTSLLCVNNIRDVETDSEAGKRTLAVRISSSFVKKIFVFLLLLSYLLNLYLLYSLSLLNIGFILFLLMAYPCFKMMFDIYGLKGKNLNLLLARVASYIFIYSIVFIFTLLI